MNGLGRRISIDTRDHGFPMQAVLAEPPDITRRFWWTGGLWADQGNDGTCVGHAWAHYIEDGPVTWEGEIDPLLIYREATLRDPWPENDDGDLSFGTSVRAGAKYLQEIGKISEYRWAWDLDTVVQALLATGPVVVGTNWYLSMFNPNRGILSIDGGVVGGHAYLLNGVNTVTQMLRVKNSWGRGWANKGHASLRFGDFARLLAEDGEACLAVEGPS